jgi:hypothetical protein
MRLAASMTLLGLLALSAPALCWDGTEALVIDHSTSELSTVPMEWIDSVRVLMRMHYVHTSHGEQLTEGLRLIENGGTVYDAAVGFAYLPAEDSAFCVYDDSGAPQNYFSTESGMDKTRGSLGSNPTINMSMFGWCAELNSYSEAEVQVYLDSMAVLESEYPDVIFIYMTGNAQLTGASGYNRYLRNEQIRDYCRTNNKVLYDFADLDCWWYNPAESQWERSTYDYEGNTVPYQHPQFNGDESGHTTYESCEQKGRALWWMASELAGWPFNAAVENRSWGFIKRQNIPK